jgi:hypothetical protein
MKFIYTLTTISFVRAIAAVLLKITAPRFRNATTISALEFVAGTSTVTPRKMHDKKYYNMYKRMLSIEYNDMILNNLYFVNKHQHNTCNYL